jgi:predicted glycogen debranching enzyme
MKTREKVTWRGLLDGPWPMVHVGGELENAEQEWLHTNGTGAYAMSTVALMHTRRHHGLLVASLGALERYVVISHLETTIEVEGRTYRLSTHQFPNVAPTPGYRMLETFAQDPLPRWVFAVGRGSLERTLCMVRGHNAVVLGFTWTGKEAVQCKLRPLMPLRPSEELTREHGAMLQTVTLRPGEVDVQPVLSLPNVRFRHGGMFMGSPDWWRRFEYLEDRGRYEDFQEDMWSPGVFELTLVPGRTEYLVIALGDLPEREPSEWVMEAVEHLLAQDPGQDWDPAVRALSVAAETFVIEPDCTLAAGYPWLDVWSRDVALALAGVHLTRGHVQRARRCLAFLCGQLVEGLLPTRLPPRADLPRRRGVRELPNEPALDATLWLFEAARLFAARAGHQEPLLADVVYPALKSIFETLTTGRSEHGWITPDGFLENGGASALTWMDARTNTHLVTPRKGLAVELQALWSRACETLAFLARDAGDSPTEAAATAAAETLRAQFRHRFWCNQTGYPFDCVSGARHAGDAWADPSVRPNALIALAVDPDLFEPWQRRALLERCDRELLTPRGLRSLATTEANYIGHVGGTVAERQASYHQGPVWPYLLGFYVRATLLVHGDDPQVAPRLRELVEGALADGVALGQVAQTADGDAPHRWRGCPAQACSVAVLLDLLMNVLPPRPEDEEGRRSSHY